MLGGAYQVFQCSSPKGISAAAAAFAFAAVLPFDREREREREKKVEKGKTPEGKVYV